MSEETSLISMHPFFRGFVLSVVQTIKERDFELEQRVVIDADLVPRGSEDVVRASMKTPVVVPVVSEEPRVVIKKDMSELAAPIAEPVVREVKEMKKSVEIPRVEPVRRVAPVQRVRPAVVPPMRPRPIAPPARSALSLNKPRYQAGQAAIVVPERPPQAVAAPVVMAEGAVDETEEYGKISPLLNDPSVSTIECLGEGKELMIIRAGQKQRTRIVLSADEIKAVLDRVADETHIPLLEGVFRASVTGFSVNAVISEMVGSRFVIKKATAYNLLE